MEDEMDMRRPYDEPGDAVAEQGEVMLDGPDGIAVSMTPNAAEVTGHRLIAAANAARNQGQGRSDD